MCHRLRLRSTPSRALNISLFECPDGQDCKENLELPVGRETMTSGAYLDAPCGVTTGLKVLKAGTYFAIPSTYAVGTEASWEVIAHCNKREVQIEWTQ
jgi:hypothetical protein